NREGALQRVRLDPRVGLVGPGRFFAARDFEGVATVDDVDLVPVPRQRPREPVDERRIAAEAVGPEERGEHAELHADLLRAAAPATSGSEPARLATTGVPHAIASTGGRPKPSISDGCTSATARL